MICLATFFCILGLAAVAELLPAAVFYHTVIDDIPLPDAAAINTDMLAAVLGSWFPTVFLALLAALLLALVLLLHQHRVRRVFVALGLASWLSAACSAALGVTLVPFAGRLPDGLLDLVVPVTGVYSDLMLLAAVCLAVAGSVLMAVYFCIRAFGR